ncbi:hypothetical protein CYMTET_39742 [Cymbomonas tetramitiformis]|uniref:Reverse transcriptase domain-containing protein n=1 Tax=Cymbomonas tetramitiformis TaxID=36881 RepID=A0AAE0CAP2_9CHLO|nr:hypothetical protein CYMTET_39742 [Cymbomonas tetramitiformis]
MEPNQYSATSVPQSAMGERPPQSLYHMSMSPMVAGSHFAAAATTAGLAAANVQQIPVCLSPAPVSALQYNTPMYLRSVAQLPMSLPQPIWDSLASPVPLTAPYTLGAHHPRGSFPSPYPMPQQQWHPLSHMQAQPQWHQAQYAQLQAQSQQLQQLAHQLHQQQLQQIPPPVHQSTQPHAALQHLQEPTTTTSAMTTFHDQDGATPLQQLVNHMTRGAQRVDDARPAGCDPAPFNPQGIAAEDAASSADPQDDPAPLQDRARRRSRRTSAGPATHRRNLPAHLHPERSTGDTTDTGQSSSGDISSCRETRVRSYRRRKEADRRATEQSRSETAALLTALKDLTALKEILELGPADPGKSPAVDPPPQGVGPSDEQETELGTTSTANGTSIRSLREAAAQQALMGETAKEVRIQTTLAIPLDHPQDPLRILDQQLPLENEGGPLVLTSEVRRRPEVTGDSLIYRIMHNLGAPLTTYARLGGRLHHVPRPLNTTCEETWALVVDQEAMDKPVNEGSHHSAGGDLNRALTAGADQHGLGNIHLSLPAPEAPATQTPVPHAPSSQRFAGPTWKSTFPRPPLNPRAQPFAPGVMPIPAGVNLTASADEIRQEHKTKEMVLKLVKGVPKFPKTAADSKSADKDGLLAQLEQYSNLVRKIFQEAIVVEALCTPSCTPSVSDYQASTSSVLWSLKEHTLQDQQKLFLDRAAGIFESDTTWHQRYTDLELFFSDLAVCSFTQGYLENVHGEAIALRHAASESAAEYFSRLETRMASVNFLSGRVPHCVSMSNADMLSTYRRGLKYATKVMRRLRGINLDVSKPDAWEKKAEADNIPGTHRALLKIREIAEEVENDMEAEAARKRSSERPSQRPAYVSTSPNPRGSFFRRTPANSRPTVAMLEGASSTRQLAAAAVPPPPPGLAPPNRPPRVRKCFACGSTERLVGNCTDEAKLREWKANAPARLANSPAFVAAVIWAIEQGDQAGDLDAPEEISEEILALVGSDDNQSLQTLAALANIELLEEEETLPSEEVWSNAAETLPQREVRSDIAETLPQGEVRSANAETLPPEEVWSPTTETLPLGEVWSNDLTSMSEEEEDPPSGRRNGDPWGNRPIPKHVAFHQGSRRRAAPKPGDSILTSHPLQDEEIEYAHTQARIQGRRDPRKITFVAPRSPSPREPSAVDDWRYQDNLSGSSARLTAWKWKARPHSRPVETALRQIRVAMRKSPEAARAAADKIQARAASSHGQSARAPKRYHQRAAELMRGIQQARDAEERHKGHQRIAFRHLSKCFPPPPTPLEQLERHSAWKELTPKEQAEAVNTLDEGWIEKGKKRAAARKMDRERALLQRAAHLSALDTEVGTIPGSGGGVSIPDAWCSLYRVRQFRARERGQSPLSLPPLTERDLEGYSASNEGEEEEHGPNQSEPDDPSHPSLEDFGFTIDEEAPQDDCTVRETTPTIISAENTIPSGSASAGSDLASARAYLSSDGVMHASATDSGTSHVSETSSGTTHVSATGSDTTHVSPTPDGAPVDGMLTSCVEEVLSHPLSNEVPVSLKCESVLTDGGIQWRPNLRGTLAVAHDSEGPLLMVFYATLRGQTVKVLVDSGASDNFISERSVLRCGLKQQAGTEMRVTLADGSMKITGATTYAKFSTNTTTGTYTENALALRVLPLGIHVDVILGGKWLRSHSPITLDYEEYGSVSFQRKSRSGEKESAFAAKAVDGAEPSGDNQDAVGELRLVIDYRQLNRQTIKDKCPLPDIQMMFDEMQGAKFFSSFDAVDGFWQVPMAPGDVEKTAFTTQMGSYEWLVMPQGLQNSPSHYQRRMQRALGHLPFVRIFIDDIVVFSNTVEEHYDHVRQLLLICREKGVFLKRSKCQLLKSSLRFLGHTISAGGCRPQHDKVAPVRERHYGERHPRQTDASGVASGGVLMQDQGDGKGLKVIAYESRQFTAA